METKVMNFKRMEVTGATKAEALEKAPFFIQGDATQAYNNWKKTMTNGITDSDKKQFMLNYLEKKSKFAPGIGYCLTVDAAVADTRERPYKFKDTKNEQGARKYKTTYQIYENLGTDEKPVFGRLLAECKETKAKAKDLAKKLITEGGFHGKGICTYTKQVIEGEPVAFAFEYTPSKSTRIGTYLVFGVENC